MPTTVNFSFPFAANRAVRGTTTGFPDSAARSADRGTFRLSLIWTSPNQRDSLLFPAKQGGHLAPATMNRWYYKARDKAGRPDLRFHDLRHSGAVLAASTGATLVELMGRLGHSTPAAAMRYQHAAQGRDREIAALLSKLANNK
jgi:integrase